MSPLLAAWLTTAAYQDATRNFEDGTTSKSLDGLDHRKLCDRHTSFLEAIPANKEPQEPSLTTNDSIFFSGM